MDETLAECQRVIGYHFANPQLLVVALTHSSLRSPDRECNERLEFLGDSVLGLVITEELYRLLPDQAEGELTRLKSAIVSRGSLFHASQRLGLVRFAVFARGVGRRDELPVSVTANLVEAVIGAIYLDAGFFPAREFVLRHLGRELEETLADRGGKNFKSLLQHEVQEVWQATPTYRTLEEGGPDHRKQFTIAAVIRGAEWGRASGATKKEAEQEAARLALEAFQRRGRGRRRRRAGRGDGAGGNGRAPGLPLAPEAAGDPPALPETDPHGAAWGDAEPRLLDSAPPAPDPRAQGPGYPEPTAHPRERPFDLDLAGEVAEGPEPRLIGPEPDVWPLSAEGDAPGAPAPTVQRQAEPAPERPTADEDPLPTDPVERREPSSERGRGRSRGAGRGRGRGRSARSPEPPAATPGPTPAAAPAATPAAAPAGEGFDAGLPPPAPPPPAPAPRAPTPAARPAAPAAADASPAAPAPSAPARRKAPAAWTPPAPDEGFDSGL